MPSHSPGTRLGPYELVSIIGAGGMGEVWKARDTRVDRTVAVKFAQAGFSERFERESRAIAALNHPHICQLYDVGPDYLVMEFVDGDALRPPGDWRALLDQAIAIADGLAAAHAAGVVHRDLKPDNILVRRDGVLKILDFGLAKLSGDGLLQTRTMPMTGVGNIVGTVAYMSPEQATGRDTDARSDQFTFGLILYELASGKRPFERPSSAETMAAIIRDEAEPLPADVPRPLAWIIERCLAKDPALRYDATRDLYRELFTVRQHFSEISRAAVQPPLRPLARRRRLRDGALTAFGVALGAVAVVLWPHAQSPRDGAWSGVRLGGAAISINPRLSPDGHLLAFVAMVNGVTELAVMEPGSASWTLLTHGSRDGYVQNVSWSHDGSKLYFDRFWGQPAGVYAIPPLGGTPVQLLAKAFQPQALPDGSLLVARVSGSYDQVFRFWPRDGKLQPLPAFLEVADVAAPFRAFADGRRLAFVGRQRGDDSQPNALRVLDLQTGSARVLDAGATIEQQGFLSLPLAVTPDGAAVIILVRHGDTYDVIQVRSDGTPGHRVLMTLRETELPWFIEAAADGSLYLDLVGRPSSLVRLSGPGRSLEQFPSFSLDLGPILALPDGRMAVQSGGAKSQVLIGTPGSELRPFLQLDEPAGGPLALAGRDAIAFVAGTGERRRIALASLADGHLIRDIPLRSGLPPRGALAVSSDGNTIYYAESGAVYAQARSGPPRRLAEGDTITLDPAGRYLYAKQFSRDPIRLVRIDVISGETTEVHLRSEARLTSVGLSPTAVDVNQQMLVDTSSPLEWFYRAAILDLRSGVMTPLPMPHLGDCLSPGWGADATIYCNSVGLTASLWRYEQRAVRAQQ